MPKSLCSTLFILLGLLFILAFLPMRLNSLRQEFRFVIIESIAKKDPPLRYYSLYKVTNESGLIETIRSSKANWPKNMPKGTIVDKKKGEALIRINGKPAMSEIEDFLLGVLPIWLGFVMVTAGVIMIRAVKPHEELTH